MCMCTDHLHTHPAAIFRQCMGTNDRRRTLVGGEEVVLVVLSLGAKTIGQLGLASVHISSGT